MSNPFNTLTALRDEWQALQPPSAENEARLWKKLRLEWNYHSNHIEGNTLTQPAKPTARLPSGATPR